MLSGKPVRRPGVSLIELLVVLALLAFLLGLLLAGLGRIREAAARTQCQNNLKQLCLATINCADNTKQFLPPLVGSFPAQQPKYGTLFFHVLPYLEQVRLYEQTKNSVWEKGTFSTPVRLFVCPSDLSAPADYVYGRWLATTSYAGNWQLFGQGGARYPASISDGTAQTIMFTERYQLCQGTPCGWGYAGVADWAPAFARSSQGKFQVTPPDSECNPAQAQTPHPVGIQVAMADGSVRTVAGTISPQTWWYACTPAGNDILDSDF